MTFGSIFILAIGLAMDATAVSAARGLAAPRIDFRLAFSIAVFFGGFQALMPVIGWLVGAGLGPYVQAWDHWIAFGLLGALGSKMLWEAKAQGDGPDNEHNGNVLDLRVLLVLAIATSIDALAVGVTLPLLHAPFLLSIATIGVTTAVLSVLGLHAGHRFGSLLGKRLDILGGVVLIGLGCKILVEHLRA